MTHGSAIYMSPGYLEYLKRRAQNGGALTLSVLSALAPVEVGMQLAEYIRLAPDGHHVTLSQSFDMDNAGTAIYGSAFIGP
jgi:hypothetical protein